MIINAGHFTVQPGTVDDCVAALSAVRPTVLEEAGCRAYDFGVDVDDPSRINLFEIYDDMDAFRHHMTAPHTAQLFEVLTPALVGRPATQLYEAAEVARPS